MWTMDLLKVILTEGQEVSLVAMGAYVRLAEIPFSLIILRTSFENCNKYNVYSIVCIFYRTINKLKVIHFNLNISIM